jgi:hypothetical protein
VELDYDTDFYAAKWSSDATKKGSEQISLSNHTRAHHTHTHTHTTHDTHTHTQTTHTMITYFPAGVILHLRKLSRR